MHLFAHETRLSTSSRPPASPPTGVSCRSLCFVFAYRHNTVLRFALRPWAPGRLIPERAAEYSVTFSQVVLANKPLLPVRENALKRTSRPGKFERVDQNLALIRELRFCLSAICINDLVRIISADHGNILPGAFIRDFSPCDRT